MDFQHGPVGFAAKSRDVPQGKRYRARKAGNPGIPKSHHHRHHGVCIQGIRNILRDIKVSCFNRRIHIIQGMTMIHKPPYQFRRQKAPDTVPEELREIKTLIAKLKNELHTYWQYQCRKYSGISFL